jgi:hypothetical protein
MTEDLAQDTLNTIHKYIVLDEADKRKAIYFIASTWLGCFEWTQLLMILASESKCGRGRLKKLIQWMVPHAYNSSSASSAWVYTQITKRKKEGYTPTLFINEIGKYFNGKRDTSEMASVLCAGVEKDEKAHRVTFENGRRDVEELETFCPKVLSGIQNESRGFFPESLLSRANIIRMHKRTSKEKVSRFRTNEVKRECS